MSFAKNIFSNWVKTELNSCIDKERIPTTQKKKWIRRQSKPAPHPFHHIHSWKNSKMNGVKKVWRKKKSHPMELSQDKSAISFKKEQVQDEELIQGMKLKCHEGQDMKPCAVRNDTPLCGKEVNFTERRCRLAKSAPFPCEVKATTSNKRKNSSVKTLRLSMVQFLQKFHNNLKVRRSDAKFMSFTSPRKTN